MGNAGEIRGGRLGGRDVEAAINLQGVAADDLAAQAQGEGDRDVGLTGAGGARDDQQARVQREPRPPASPSRAWSRSSSIAFFMWS